MTSVDFPFTTLNQEMEILHEIDPVKSSGIGKLVRMYVKFLLTRKGTNLDDPAYGTYLIDIIGSTTDKEGLLVKSQVVEAVNTANKWFNEMQLTGKVDDESMLREGRIVSVSYEADGGRVVLRLALYNQKGRVAVFGLAL